MATGGNKEIISRRVAGRFLRPAPLASLNITIECDNPLSMNVDRAHSLSFNPVTGSSPIRGPYLHPSSRLQTAVSFDE